jgi:hypothetical protein
VQLQQTFTPTFWRASMELGLLNFLGTAFQVCVMHLDHALAVAVHSLASYQHLVDV